MPLRRNYKKRYPKRSRKSYRRRFKRRSMLNRRGERKFMYTRNCDRGVLTLTSGSSTFAGFDFSLNDLPNNSEFTALYDNYKINAVKISFIPQQDANVSLSLANNAIANARFFSAIDYTDSSGPVTINELREYKTVKWTSLLRTHTRYIYKPKILDSSGFSVAPWMATTSSAANYFGLKIAIEDIQSTGITSFTYKIECKYYLSFKNVK